MALIFTAAEENYTVSIKNWKGLDYDTFVDNTDLARSKNMKNMLVNENGFAEKRTGYKRTYIHGSNERINGIFTYNAVIESITSDSVTKEAYNLIHIGTKLYLFTFDTNKNIVLGSLLLEDLKNTKTRAFEFGGCLYIIGAGYIKVCIDKFTNNIIAGFVSYAGNLIGYSNIDSIITDRHPNYLDGTFNRPDTAKMQKSITYTRAEDSSGYHVNFDTDDKFLISKAKNTSGINVTGAYIIDSSGKEFNLVTSAPVQYYAVKSDETYGTYVQLLSNFWRAMSSSATNANGVYEVKVVFSDADFVYTPLVVTDRTSFWIKFDGSGDTSTEYTRYTGTNVEGVNLTSTHKAVRFYYNTAQKTDSVTQTKVRLYLMPENVSCTVYQIRFNDYIWNYSDYEGAKDYIAFGKNYVDIYEDSIPFTEGTITVYFRSGKTEKDIDNCKIFGLYGGDNDLRVFLSGNEMHPCRDYKSGLYDATYFPDTGYTDIGGDNSAIVGYAKMYSSQIIIKDGAGESSTQYLRNTATDSGNNTVYTLSQGASSYPGSAVSSFKNIGGYPYYIGKDGFFMMYGTNVKMETNTGCKSELINDVFTKEDTSNFICITHRNMFYAYINHRMYICDAQREHEWYYFDNLPEITCLWVWEDLIYFGTEDGRVCRFMDRTEKNAYCDNLALDGSIASDTEAIHALWEIPQNTYGTITNYKTIRNVHFDCLPYTKSHVTVYYNSNEDCMDLVMDKEKICMFSWFDMNFNFFSFITIQAPQGFATRVKNKNIYTFGLTLENKEMGEPFGFAAVTVTYRNGKVVK